MRGTWHPTVNKWRDENGPIHFVPRDAGSALCGKGRQKYNSSRVATLSGPVDPAGRNECEVCKKVLRGIELRNKGKMTAILYLLESEHLTDAEVQQIAQAIPSHVHEDYLADWYDSDAAVVIESLKDAIREGRQKK